MFVGHFSPLGSGSGLRIQSGSGSVFTTLENNHIFVLNITDPFRITILLYIFMIRTFNPCIVTDIYRTRMEIIWLNMAVIWTFYPIAVPESISFINVETSAKCLMQGITKRCRPSWQTNSALVYDPKCGGCGGGLREVSANEYSCAHGAQINFGDLTPYLFNPWFDLFRKPEYRHVIGSLGTTALHTLLPLVSQIAQVGLLYYPAQKLSGFNANLSVLVLW